jgi:hypothetical protein
MLESTNFHDALIRQDTTIERLSVPPAENLAGGPFPPRKKFLMRQPLLEETLLFRRQNDEAQAAPRDQAMRSPKVLVALDSERGPRQKVTMLQRWIGRVEEIKTHTFVAVVSDATASQHPPEEVELDCGEIPRSDLPLVFPGAAFYWTIGYEDSPGGQRQRVSALRFVRQPRLSKTLINRIFDRADRLATFLEH